VHIARAPLRFPMVADAKPYASTLKGSLDNLQRVRYQA
jgi:hypothetical protein